MFKKVINIFFLFSFVLFAFLVTKYYFSDQNYIYINKSRSLYSLRLDKYNVNLPVLKNDTKNIIIYKKDLEEFKSKRKERFWEKLISNLNE